MPRRRRPSQTVNRTRRVREAQRQKQLEEHARQSQSGRQAAPEAHTIPTHLAPRPTLAAALLPSGAVLDGPPGPGPQPRAPPGSRPAPPPCTPPGIAGWGRPVRVCVEGAAEHGRRVCGTGRAGGGGPAHRGRPILADRKAPDAAGLAKRPGHLAEPPHAPDDACAHRPTHAPTQAGPSSPQPSFPRRPPPPTLTASASSMSPLSLMRSVSLPALSRRGQKRSVALEMTMPRSSSLRPSSCSPVTTALRVAHEGGWAGGPWGRGQAPSFCRPPQEAMWVGQRRDASAHATGELPKQGSAWRLGGCAGLGGTDLAGDRLPSG